MDVERTVKNVFNNLKYNLSREVTEKTGENINEWLLNLKKHTKVILEAFNEQLASVIERHLGIVAKFKAGPSVGLNLSTQEAMVKAQLEVPRGRINILPAIVLEQPKAVQILGASGTHGMKLKLKTFDTEAYEWVSTQKLLSEYFWSNGMTIRAGEMNFAEDAHNLHE